MAVRDPPPPAVKVFVGTGKASKIKRLAEAVGGSGAMKEGGTNRPPAFWGIK